ncbi:MAG: hypothetical protein Q4D57_02435 [Clostridia bacterium]|nr:hypothetical protein [Clostridia bacterium]
MKRRLYLNLLICFVLEFALAFLAMNVNIFEAKPAHSEKVSCGKILCDGNIQVFETLEVGEEEVYFGNDNNVEIYKKGVSVTKQFKKRIKENVYETKAEVKQKFTFRYDKKEQVEISPEDISSEFTVTSWKISPLSRISVDDGVCSVSNQYRVYDKNFVGNYQYMCDGFMDIFCDTSGEIGINSDVRW